MNNVGCFEAAWLFIWNIIKHSFTYKILKRLYDIISGAWKNSRITSWFRKLHINEDALGKTVAGRVVRCPFTFIEFLQRKFGDKLACKIEKSAVINLCGTYLNNLLALNLRFIGLITVSGAVGMAAAKLLTHGSLGYIIIGVGIVGVILSFFDVNFVDYFKESRIVSAVWSLIDVDNEIFICYDSKYTKGKARYFVSVISGLVFGFVGGYMMPLLTPALIVGVFAVFFVMKKTSFGVILILLAAPIVPTMADVGLCGLCLVSLIIYAITHSGFKFKFDGIGFFVIIFIAIYLVAGLNSFAVKKSLSIWAIYFIFMTAYFLIINCINSKRLLNVVLSVFVLSGLLVCLYGIAQYVFGWDTNQAWMDEEMFEDIKMRIYSTLDNPNVLGEYILLVLPVAIGLMWTKKKAFAKVFYAGVSAVMFGALILTFSRGCWIGIMIAAAIFITFAAGKLWGIGFAALPFVPMILPDSIINRITSIGNMEDSSTSYRVYIWMGSLAMIKDFWISGIGMGQEAFTQVYPFYSYNGIVAPHSHNLFLQILVESGIVGIVVFLIIAILFLRRIMTGYQYGGKGSEMSTVMTAIAAGVCGFLVQGMFDNCFYNYRVMLIFWCTLALGRACVYIAKKGSESSV